MPRSNEENDERIRTGRAPEQPRSLVWVFSGHGSQWAGMGRELYACEPVFAAAVDALDPVFVAEAGWSLSRRIQDDDLGCAATDIAQQPALYGIQVALAALWRAYGAQPAAVIGHSVGELAAAVAAGAVSAPDGARLACRWAAALRPVVGRGAMLLVEQSEDEVRRLIARRGELSVAILPSPDAVVVSGSRDAIAALAAHCESVGLPARRIACDVAGHSPDMDGPAVQLRRAAAELPHRRPMLPVYRTALADPRERAPFDANYWATSLRSPVRLHSAVSAAVRDGHGCFLEISPHPVVTHSILLTLAALGSDAVAMGSLRRGRPERATMRQSLDALHCAGVKIASNRWYPAGGLLDVPPVSSTPEDPDALREQVHQLLAAELGIPSSALAADRPMRELGVDSVTAVRIRGRLAEATGLELPATLVWSHPTVSGLTSFLASMLFVSEPTTAGDALCTGRAAARAAGAGLGGLLDEITASPETAAPTRTEHR